MKDLADELGISRTTVSIVLKGKADQYRISQETRQKILDLVEKEDYKPNFFARGLNRGRTNTVAVIFPDIFEEFMVEMVRGIGEILEKADHTMILMTSGFSSEREKKNLEELYYRGIDGILLVPSCGYSGTREEQSHLSESRRGKTPMVLIDRIPEGWVGSKVVQDDFQGGVIAARFLDSKGCSKKAVVSLNLGASSIKNRMAGFSSVSHEYTPILLNEQNSHSHDLTKALDFFSRNYIPGSPLGVFATTAGLAVRVKEILDGFGLVLNREYFVIRFGEDPRGYKSGIASISQPHYQMGKEAASQLLRQMNDEPPRSICLPVSLLQ